MEYNFHCFGADDAAFSALQTNLWPFSFSGSFLIPYLLCVVFAGVPLLVLEIAMGQLMSQGCLTAWKICPIFQGGTNTPAAFQLIIL